jgi:hypothetical protein
VYYTPNFEKTQRLSTKNTLISCKNLRRLKKTGSLHKIIPPVENFFCHKKGRGQTARRQTKSPTDLSENGGLHDILIGGGKNGSIVSDSWTKNRRKSPGKAEKMKKGG